MLQRKDRVVTSLTRGIASLIRKNKITRYTGSASFLSPSRLRVQGSKGSLELEGKHILIATGSRVAGLPDIDFDGQRIGTSTEALSYSEVPTRLAVIGAGLHRA